jgi:superfamily II DNA or RNA helicase
VWFATAKGCQFISYPGFCVQLKEGGKLPEKALLMEKDLHDYQKFCVDFVEGKPQCALFLDCGLGKTVIALTAISHLLYDSFEVSRVLIVAPLRVARDTWIAELDKWEHLQGLRM